MYVRHGARIGADDTHAEACCRRMLRREGRRERGGVGVGGVFFCFTRVAWAYKWCSFPNEVLYSLSRRRYYTAEPNPATRPRAC